MKKVNMKNNIGVHESHCCKEHGCKYGDVNCPVIKGEIKQKYPCEDCDGKDITEILKEWYPIETAPKDGTEILLKTHVGIVSAWGDPTDFEWVCYDDMFTLDFDDSTIEGWRAI